MEGYWVGGGGGEGVCSVGPPGSLTIAQVDLVKVNALQLCQGLDVNIVSNSRNWRRVLRSVVSVVHALHDHSSPA